MTPQRFLNVVYAHLVAGADDKGRDEFDKQLYAPAGGWAAVQQRLFAIAGEG